MLVDEASSSSGGGRSFVNDVSSPSISVLISTWRIVAPQTSPVVSPSDMKEASSVSSLMNTERGVEKEKPLESARSFREKTNSLMNEDKKRKFNKRFDH
jgi:hypothetical protein